MERIQDLGPSSEIIWYTPGEGRAPPGAYGTPQDGKARKKTLFNIAVEEGYKKDPAITYFRAESTIIGPKGFTALFGMGKGSPPWVSSPGYA